jgi:rfaE bifunctional protein nucleotidyltransferase chain/domain
MRNKLLTSDLIAKRFQSALSHLVLCHGVFDLMHPGHVKHLEAAKRLGTHLVVSVTADEYANRGPGRPIWSDHYRASLLASLECVDYVCICDEPDASSVIRLLKPSVYVKGQECEDPVFATPGFINEREAAQEVGAKIEFTHEQMYSTSKLIEKIKRPTTESMDLYLQTMRSSYSSKDIADILANISKLNVLVIGDFIADVYEYIRPLGLGSKGNRIVFLSEGKEDYFAGGAIAIARQVETFAKKMRIATMYGNNFSLEDYTLKNAESVGWNVIQGDRNGTIKKRYCDPYLSEKIFEVNYIDDKPLSKELEETFIEYLHKTLPVVDYVIVADFGHGLMTPGIIETIEYSETPFSVMAQRNAANPGYRQITDYQDANYICLNLPELESAVRSKHIQHKEALLEVMLMCNASKGAVTLGRNGALMLEDLHDMGITESISPAFAVGGTMDTMGAGDVFFAITSLCDAVNAPLPFTIFLGNALAAQQCKIKGNERRIGKDELSEFASGLLS